MRLGIIYCSYGMPEYINNSLSPWIKSKGLYDIKIAAVHGQFKEYHENGLIDDDRETQDKLKLLELEKEIDFLYLQYDYSVFPPDKHYNPIYQTEAEIRDNGLRYLLTQNCDWILLWDGDEEITEKEINYLFEYLSREDSKLYGWFRIEYRNLTFSNKLYTKGFSPPRVFNANYQNKYRLNNVIYDNDMSYLNIITNDIVNYQQLANKIIPPNHINPLHYSWNDFERSRKKIQYQEKHFSYGMGCSFRVNDEKKCIEFNLDYYRKINQSPPELYEIS
jgi:hypothetical protein